MQSVLPTLSESDRVTRLRAACIRTLLLRAGIEISDDEALKLARVHKIRAAIRRVQESISVQNRSLERERVVRHSVQEAILAGDPDKVVGVREVFLDRNGEMVEHIKAAEKSQRVLWAMGLEVAAWSRDYATFLADIQRLYSLRLEQLNSFHLSSERKLQAAQEIDSLFATAITRSAITRSAA